MPCRTQLHRSPAFIEAVYEGLLTAEELVAAANAIISLGRENNVYRILADCTALSGGHSVIDLYALADWLAANHADVRIREALVLPTLPLADDNVRFWETACYNRGLTVRVFNDRPSALDWLHK